MFHFFQKRKEGNSKSAGKQLQKSSKKGVLFAEELAKTRFGQFNAAWLWDDTVKEYTDLYHCEYTDELLDRIYIYCCNYFAYLFAWLVKRDGLNPEYLDELDAADALREVRQEKSDPAVFLYHYMDGKVCRDDIAAEYLRFLDQYYERFGFRQQERTICYDVDYNEIVRKDAGASYCMEFSWDVYRKLEKVLDKRYEKHEIDYSFEGDWTQKVYKSFYCESFQQELEVRVADGVSEDYINLCLEHCNRLQASGLKKIYAAFAEWLDMLPDEEAFWQSVGAGDMLIPKPYGPEPAYVLGFEADFEEEHGISVVIRGDKVLDAGYRMDRESPWSYEE